MSKRYSPEWQGVYKSNLYRIRKEGNYAVRLSKETSWR
jgi:hypothetical protein